jgi:acyl-CoA synthetase (AMP-forming)/AMP-acid ligase II
MAEQLCSESTAHAVNIAERLRTTAALTPQQPAVIVPAGRDRNGRPSYEQLTFEELDRQSDRLARGLRAMGVQPGTRLVLMVRPGLEFIALTFALFKAGAVTVLIDPGMGRANVFRCLDDVEPEGFVAIPIVQAVRALSRGRFARARWNVTVGRRFFWGGKTYQDLLGGDWTPFEMAATRANDPAAIIFTSGSTGPPKGVLYEHGMFDAQVDLLREFYGIQPGEIDLSGFPLFALFNAGMGVTTVIPDMNPSRPADVDPVKIVEAIHDLKITQAFGSPALWNRVGRYCEVEQTKLPSLKRVLSAGAPVPLHVLQRMCDALTGEEADIHTPYGATESLPICSISGRAVLRETAARSRTGAGTCVGNLFPQVQLKIIAMTDGPIETIDKIEELPNGEIGEIIVRAPSTTREYFRKPEATAAAKITDGDSLWHRMGDVGYLDENGALWFCGRKAHIVETDSGRMFSVRCEAIFNEHPRVFRAALVGVGEKQNQRPVIVVEPESGQFPKTAAAQNAFCNELAGLAIANPLTERIETFLFHQSLPVDVRHNVKIAREKLAVWAADRLK